MQPAVRTVLAAGAAENGRTSAALWHGRLSRKVQIALINLMPILLIWSLCTYHVSSTYNLMRSDANRETLRLARTVEENARRTVSEVERMISYIREMHAAFGGEGSWPIILEKRFATSSMVAQVAAMGKDGYLISSSAQLRPNERQYFGDRDHVRVHLTDPTDKLYISTPVLGRVSGKWSVQFTRPFYDENRDLGGVIVVSLDLDYLAATYRNMELDDGSGIALIGPEGIIRAGRGLYAQKFGQHIPAEALEAARPERAASGSLIEALLGGDQFVVRTLRDLGDIPLRILFENRSTAAYKIWVSNARANIVAALGLSLCSFLLTSLFVRRRQAYERTLNRLAYFDAPTGLANRRLFLQALHEKCRAAADDSEVILLMIDIDQLKNINDRYGQNAGDSALSQLAWRLAQRFGKANAIVARLGGDEFAVVANAGPNDDLDTICDAVLADLRAPFQSDRQQLKLTCCVGAARMKADNGTEHQLMHAATFALLEAKRRGGNRYQLFDAELNSKVEREIEIEAGLIEALQEGRLDVYFQPVVKADNHAVVGYEALVRWKKDDGTFVSPGEFVPVAEARGLIGPLERFVVERVFSVANRLLKHPDMAISINISASELHNGEVLTLLKQCAERYGVNPRNIRIEITETAILRDIDIAVQELKQIRDYGFQILLDDFGTGFSSLSYLLMFPVSGLKIDRSFVRGLGSASRDQIIVSSIVHIARDLGLRVVAEGVEYEQQAKILAEMGVDFLQGFLFGHATPVDVLCADEPVCPKAGSQDVRRFQGWGISKSRSISAASVANS